VSKGAIVKCVKAGATDFGKVKTQTKVGAGCGGCVPLATSIFKGEMKKLGHSVNNK
jgi:nitrite reductase (NAD(P)H)